MSSADAILTTLLLQKGVVRCYSNLDSDVGKHVVITDKFNPLSVKEGTLDASLNLLFELPAFTTYNVKMYGLDGETVESDQNFKLDGYSYVEMNIGLNKNSFAGIKAIVDQGLEGDLIDIGHEFTEDDNVGDDGARWVVVAKDMDEFHRHSVFLARKYVLPNYVSDTMINIWNNHYNNVWTRYLNNSYFENLPNSIKNAITPRNLLTWYRSTIGSQAAVSEGYHEQKVWVPSLSEVRGRDQGVLKSSDNSGNNINVFSVPTEHAKYPQLPYYAEDSNRAVFYRKTDLAMVATYLRSGAEPTAFMSGNYITQAFIASQTLFGWYGGNNTVAGLSMIPHIMIASDPIE